MLFLIYLFNKHMRDKIQGLYVDMQGLNQVKKHIEKGQKVIFLPLYKTFIDFFVMVYVNQTQGIPSGFTFGNHDDIPKILIMKEILHRTGYISSRRKQG